MEKGRASRSLAQLYDYWADQGKRPSFKVSDYILKSGLYEFSTSTNEVSVGGRKLHPRFSVRSEYLFPGGTLFITDEDLYLWWADGQPAPVIFKAKRLSYRREKPVKP